MVSRLHLDEMANKEENTAEIYILGVGSLTNAFNNSVKGFIESNLRLSGSNNFNAPFENDLDRINDFVERANVASGELKTGMKQFILKSAQQTILSWVGSDRFSFSLDLYFLSWKLKDRNVLKPVKTLLSAVNPLSVGNTSIQSIVEAGNSIAGGNIPALGNFNVQTIAPYGYTTSNENGFPVGVLGTCNVRFGKWFKARQLLIKSVDFDISNVPTEDGNPLWARCNVTFQSFKMLSADEVLSFIQEQ